MNRGLSGAASLVLAAAAMIAPASLAGQEAEPPTSVQLPVGRSEYVRVIDNREERVAEFMIGPVELRAGMPHLRLPIQMTAFPVDGWMHGFEVEMTDQAGAPIPMETLHHVNFIDPDKRDLFSPIARRVLAAGRETDHKEVPRLFGYPFQAGDRLLISAMFANPTGKDYPEAYLHVRIFYSLEEDGFVQPRDVYPFYLDVMGPVGPKSFPVPPGKTVRSWEGSPAIEGRILGIGGHLHNYATALRLEDVTDGKVIWEAVPEVDEQGRVTGVPIGRLWWRGGAKIRPDHVYRITVEYDNPTDEPAPDGGMGEIGGIVWAAKDVEWPPFRPDDPVYLTDLRNTLEAPLKAAGHEHGGGGHGAGEEMAPGGSMEGHDSHSMQGR